jgi:hypothetical protein
MKISVFYIVFFLLLIVSCATETDGNPTNTSILKEKIISFEDSIISFQDHNEKVPQRLNDSLISNLVQFYQRFPKDNSAGKCLDKIQMYYSGNGFYLLAVKYADTLLKNYPKYANRAMVLEGQAVNFDMFVVPRDTNKVKYYFSLLLKENPLMDKDKKKGIELRLKHIKLNFEEFVQFQASNLKSEK